ncbi:MAG TPA: hypothetical protein VNJ01_18130 [Bacteriovoracaceae bacterium]|nr:hypothetical protein [Bacteriovoracaceae bacterium]
MKVSGFIFTLIMLFSFQVMAQDPSTETVTLERKYMHLHASVPVNPALADIQNCASKLVNALLLSTNFSSLTYQIQPSQFVKSETPNQINFKIDSYQGFVKIDYYKKYQYNYCIVARSGKANTRFFLLKDKYGKELKSF